MGKRGIVYGVGINDSDSSVVYYDSDGRKRNEKAYEVWVSILKRCYSQKYRQKFPTYDGCTIHDSWKYYKNFKSWFEENYINNYHLDKDFLIEGNKVYGPTTCIFIPDWLNVFITGHGRARGEWPVGVYYKKSTGGFVSQISKNGKMIHLGVHETPEKAYEVWLTYKLKLAADKKEEMDRIDERLYPRAVEIIKRMK